MAEWSRVATTTLRKYVKGYESEVFRNRALLALLKSKGRIETNAYGTDLQWQPEYRQAGMQSNSHETTVTFARQDGWKNALLQWKGYVVADAIYDRELEINKGEAALIKVIDVMGKRLMEALEQQFPDKLISSDASSSGDLTGIDSMFSYTQTITATSNGAVARTANAADYVGYPTATYAGLSTTLGTYGGSAPTAGAWPAGVVTQPAFDFWTPLIVSYEATSFGGAAPTWAQQCVSAMRFGITHAQRNKSKKGELDMILLDRELFRQFKEKNDALQRIQVGSNTPLRSLGFMDTIMLDGVEVLSDYSIPANVGYGINADQMTLHSTKPTVFELKGPYYDEESQSTRFMARFFGNLQCYSPRHFVKFMDFGL